MISLTPFLDALNTTSYGLLSFNEDGQFEDANDQALLFLPALSTNRSHFLTLQHFLDHLYDHAIDGDESLKVAIEKSQAQRANAGFQDVMHWGDNNDKICLVDIVKSKNSHTIIMMHDFSAFWMEQKKLMRVNEINHELMFAVESATNAIVITKPADVTNTIVFANTAFCDLAGQNNDELIGQDLHTFHPIFDKASLLSGALPDPDLFFSALKGQNAIDTEVKTTSQNASKWFNAKFTPIIGADHKTQLCVGVFTDITELRQQKEQLFQSHKLEALGQLAAGVAHDFNNVLSIIEGYARMAASECTQDQNAQSDYLKKVRSAAMRGSDLTQKMLTFSRHKIIEDSVYDLNQLVSDNERLVEPLIDGLVTLDFTYSDAPLPVQCTEDGISQILLNLMINAKDAMPKGGTLSVTTSHITAKQAIDIPSSFEGIDIACLSVSDTGYGMDEETLNCIFDPFFTTKPQGKGTGLGLSVVYGLLQQMGAHITISSVIEQGTEISIFWPLDKNARMKTMSGDIADLLSIRFDGYTALIAEDEPDLRLLMTEMLEKLGFEVLSASNGNEALVLQDEHEGQIDLLLTDIVMPELNGIKLAELFGALHPNSKTIFMSGYPSKKNQSDYTLPQDAVFMAKPVRYEDLVLNIYRALNDGHKDISETAQAPGKTWNTSTPDTACIQAPIQTNLHEEDSAR